MFNKMSSDAFAALSNAGSHFFFQNNVTFLAMHLRVIIRRGNTRFLSSGMISKR